MIESCTEGTTGAGFRGGENVLAAFKFPVFFWSRVSGFGFQLLGCGFRDSVIGFQGFEFQVSGFGGALVLAEGLLVLLRRLLRHFPLLLISAFGI